MSIEVAAQHVDPFLPDNLLDWKILETLEREDKVVVGHITREPLTTVASFTPAEECPPLRPSDLKDIRKLLKVYSDDDFK